MGPQNCGLFNSDAINLKQTPQRERTKIINIPSSAPSASPACVHAHLLQSFLTLSGNPMDGSPQGSSVHCPGNNTGVGCHALSRRSSQPGDQTCFSGVSCISRQILYPLSHLGSPCPWLVRVSHILSPNHKPEGNEAIDAAYMVSFEGQCLRTEYIGTTKKNT